MRFVFLGGAVAGILLFSPFANASVELARSKNCMTCHALDKKIIGPSLNDVSLKYANDKSAESKLVAKVLSGGSGAWGTIPMPPSRQVSEAEAQILVRWILALKEKP